MGYLLRNRIIFIGSRIGDDVSIHSARSLQYVLRKSCCRLGLKLLPQVDPLYLPGWQMATQVVASLLALEAFDDKSDIKLYINSPGGRQSCAAAER